MIPSSRKAFCRLMAVLLPLVTLSACATEAPADTAAADSVKAVVRDLSATEVHQMIQDNPEVLIIDVRTPVEYNAPGGHMPGAQLKPLQEIQTWAPTLASYRDQQIILVCRSGNRSGQAMRYLQQQGFQNLVNMQGGMLDWTRKGFAVE